MADVPLPKDPTTDDVNITGSTGTITVDIVAQALNRLATAVELDDGTGTYAELQRTNNALNVAVESDSSSKSGSVNIEDTTDTQVDPATEPTLSSIAGALASNATDTLQTEQQTPVGVEDSAGTQIDPRQQPDYATAYTTVDLNATGATTIYAPTNDAEVSGVHLENTGGTAVIQLEVTDGTNTAVLDANNGGGGSIHFEDELRLDGGVDSLQINVTTAEGATLTGTAAVFRGEL